MSQSDISPVSDVPGRTPSEPASPDRTGNLSIEGGHCPGDSSPESPISDVFALDGTCMGEFSIFPIESQSYIEMHTTPDFPKYEASIPSDLAQLQREAVCEASGQCRQCLRAQCTRTDVIFALNGSFGN